MLPFCSLLLRLRRERGHSPDNFAKARLKWLSPLVFPHRVGAVLTDKPEFEDAVGASLLLPSARATFALWRGESRYTTVAPLADLLLVQERPARKPDPGHVQFLEVRSVGVELEPEDAALALAGPEHHRPAASPNSTARSRKRVNNAFSSSVGGSPPRPKRKSQVFQGMNPEWTLAPTSSTVRAWPALSSASET